MLDFHCHILPGVDDGARDLDESVRMLKAAKDVGFDRIVCTSHIKKRGESTDKLDAAFEVLRPIAEDMGISLMRGCELNLSAIDPLAVEEAERYCIVGTKTLLLEMPYDIWPPRWEDMIHKLAVKDLNVVIAHPERYLPIKQDLKIADLLEEMYCTFQVNASAIKKTLFGGIKNTTIAYLLHKKWVSYLSSDAHRVEDYECFPKAYEIMRKNGFSGRKMK